MIQYLEILHESLLVPPTSAPGAAAQPVGDGLLGLGEDLDQLPLDAAVCVPVPEACGAASVSDPASSSDPRDKNI